MGDISVPDLSASLPGKPRRLPLWLLDALWLLALAVYILAGRGAVPFHADEATQMFMSRDWEALIRQPASLFYAAEPPDADLQAERLMVAPLPRYGIGLVLSSVGYAPAVRPAQAWNWLASPEHNRAEGLVPVPAMLNTARLVASVMLALAVAGIFILGRLYGGRLPAYVASALLVLNPVLLLHGRRAMAEGPLTGFTLLALAAAAIYLARPEAFRILRRQMAMLAVIGLLAGLSFTSKYNGLLAGASIVAALVLFRLLPPLVELIRQENTAQDLLAALGQTIRDTAVVTLMAGLTSLTLMPVFWRDTAAAIRDSLAFRERMAEQHTTNWTPYGSTAERLAGLGRELAGERPRYFDISAWAPYLAPGIAAYERGLFDGFPVLPEIRWAQIALSVLGAGVAIGGVFSTERSAARAVLVVALCWFGLTAAAILLAVPLDWQRYYVQIIPPVLLFQAVALAWLLLPPSKREGQPGLPSVGLAALTLALLVGGLYLGVIRPLQGNTREMYFNATPPGQREPVGVVFAETLALSEAGVQRRGSRIEATLMWQALAPVQNEYAAILTLQTPGGLILAQTETPYDTTFTTSSWAPGVWVLEHLLLSVPPGTAPGEYRLAVSLFSAQTGQTASAVIADGQPAGQSVMLTTLILPRPARPARQDEIGLPVPQNVVGDGTIGLAGLLVSPVSGEAGQPVVLDWAWEAQRQPDLAYSVRALWLSSAGEIAAQSGPYPLNRMLAADFWRRGDLWRDRQLMLIPGVLDAGEYQLALELVDEKETAMGERGVVARMTVGAPERSYAMPPFAHKASLEWTNGITLPGYDSGDGVLTLYWQPEEAIDESLTLFVHLVDVNGEIVAQVDRVPLAGARPTAGWAPGEVISDPVQIPLPEGVPAGAYRVRVGWYRPTTGERIPLAGGEDAAYLDVTLP
ncbi:MAG: phospholipid carrier-dependent glycosyltransferase [Anaerolineae bacterium]|nr:phospholipid carrier-dependent glycosyltransferase [Anaerolineae bacterium]